MTLAPEHTSGFVDYTIRTWGAETDAVAGEPLWGHTHNLFKYVVDVRRSVRNDRGRALYKNRVENILD